MPSRLLIVDDNLDHVNLALRALREAGHTIDVARHGAEALAKAGEAKYAVIILDYRLPDTDGLQLIGKLRERSKAPIIFMTSHGSEEVAGRALDAGAVACVIKDASFGKRLVYEVASLPKDA